MLTNSHKNWLTDSGASDHMSYDLSVFDTRTLIENSNNTITIPDGRRIQVKYIGDVPLNKDLILKNVLYVPDFKIQFDFSS